ncbi:unnamed protein product [Sphagnum troendelagicum]|uniref:Uncharacterized protein n=1 Tax=Sphagnum troendelagicum TaxID=128251 RepID=A0ABP0TXD0_9BRYO
MRLGIQVLEGKAGGRKLESPADTNVWPMLEIVPGAVFNILQALGGCSASLPAGWWLDLNSGMGSVGIEALSRGCVAGSKGKQWCTLHGLRCYCSRQSIMAVCCQLFSLVLGSSIFYIVCPLCCVVHYHAVYLQKGLSSPAAELLGGKFDYISVTPYESVDFLALVKQLSVSPLFAEQTCIVLSSQLLLPIGFSAPDGYKLSRLGSALRFRSGVDDMVQIHVAFMALNGHRMVETNMFK